MKKAKTFAKPTLLAMAKNLPAQAQKEGYDGSKKSHTLRQENKKTTIDVLIDREAFYVCPVEVLPKRCEGDFKMNVKDCFRHKHGMAFLTEIAGRAAALSGWLGSASPHIWADRVLPTIILNHTIIDFT